MNGRGEVEKGGNKGDMNHLLVLSLLTHFSEWGDKRKNLLRQIQQPENEAAVVR